MTGRVGQSVVLELRRRVFWHMQRLPVAFHESYTSGRVISRQTSDIEAISALFEEGLDSLISAVLTLLLVGTGMLLLDWRLAVVVLAAFVPLTLLAGWFRRRVRDRLPAHPGGELAGHRALRRDVRRPAGGAGVPPGAAQRGDLRRAVRRLRAGQRLVLAAERRVRLRASRWWPTWSSRVVLVYGGVLVIDGAMQGGRAGVVPAVPAAVLRPAAGRLAVLQLLPGRRVGAGEALRRPGGGAVGRRAGRPSRADCSPAGRRQAGRAGVGPVRVGAVRLPGVPTSCCRTSTWTSRPGRRSRSSARPGRGQDHGGPADGPVLRPARRAGSRWTAWTCATCRTTVLRQEVVLITQESFLFEGTVAENIRLGRPQASDAEVEEAARAIGAHEFIAALPDGLRHAGRQARRPAVGRPAAAHLVRPRVHRRAGRAGARRGDRAAGHPVASDWSRPRCAPCWPGAPR